LTSHSVSSLVDNRGVSGNSLCRGIGGLVDDHGIGGVSISWGVGGRVDNRGISANLISLCICIDSTSHGVSNDSTGNLISSDSINHGICVDKTPRLFTLDQSGCCISVIVGFEWLEAPLINKIQDWKKLKFEILRDRNIARNNAHLLSMGLLSVAGAARELVVTISTAKK
jgi:hypothetical protein